MEIFNRNIHVQHLRTSKPRTGRSVSLLHFLAGVLSCYLLDFLHTVLCGEKIHYPKKMSPELEKKLFQKSAKLKQ